VEKKRPCNADAFERRSSLTIKTLYNMDNRSHGIEKIAGLALFLLSLVILAGFVPIGAGPFRGVVENAIKGMGADSVSIEGVTVALWRGLRVKELATYKRISDKGDGYGLRVENVDIRCNLGGAVAAIAVNPNIFKSDRDIFREVYERPFELIEDISGAAASLRPVKRIALRGAVIGFTGNGKQGVSVSGADVVLGRSVGGALTGSANIREADIPTLAKVYNFRVNISVDDKSLELTDGVGAVFGGKLRMNLSVDARRSKILSGEAYVNGLDLEKFCVGTGFAPGRLLGKADMEARAEEGSPIRFDSMKARGRVTVKNLTATDLALQNAPIVTQLSSDLRLLRFSEVKGGFVLAGGRLNFKEIVGVGDVLKFRSTGWVGFDGKISQDFEGEFSGGFVAGLPRIVRGSLEKTEGDGGRFMCKIGGTFHKPRIEVDKSVYDRAVGGFFKTLFNK